MNDNESETATGGRCDPYFMGIAINPSTRRIVVLGFRQTTAEIQSLAAERAPGLHWNAIDMTLDTDTIPKRISEWLILRGLPEEVANRLAYDQMAKALMQHFLTHKGG